MVCVFFCAAEFVPIYKTWQVRQWSDQLGQRTGLSVSIESVETRTPSVTVLHGVRIGHPETKVLCASVQSVEIANQQGQRLVRLIEPELVSGQVRTAYELLHNSFLCRPQQHDQATVIATEKLAIGSEHSVQTLADFSVRVYTTERSTLLDVEFRVDQPSMRPEDAVAVESCQLIVAREHTVENLETRVQIRVPVPLPCSLVRILWPAADGFGADASFEGLVDLRTSSDGWNTTIKRITTDDAESESNVGLLVRQVDFGRLCWNAPTELTGTGLLWLDHAMIDDQGIYDLGGAIRVGSGRMSQSLLNSFQTHLGVWVDPVISNQKARDILFDTASLSFRISAEGLVLRGDLPGYGIVSDASGTLASYEQSGSIPLAKLVSVTQPSTTEGLQPSNRIPAGRLARTALRWLPLGNAESRAARRGLQVSTNR